MVLYRFFRRKHCNALGWRGWSTQDCGFVVAPCVDLADAALYPRTVCDDNEIGNVCVSIYILCNRMALD